MGNFEKLRDNGLFPRTHDDLVTLGGGHGVDVERFERWEEALDNLPDDLVQRIIDKATSNYLKLQYAGLTNFDENDEFGGKKASHWLNETLDPEIVKELIMAAGRVRGTGGHGRS